MKINESLLNKLATIHGLSNYEIDLFKLAYACGLPMSEILEDLAQMRIQDQIKLQEAQLNDL